MPKEKNNLPSQKIAVLIDGGFFLKRFNALYNKDGKKTAEDIANAMYTMAHSHVGSNNILYRIFYYDCKPLEKKFHNPITHKVVDFSKTKECLFRKTLFEELKKKPDGATRNRKRQWPLANLFIQGQGVAQWHHRHQVTYRERCISEYPPERD